MLHPRTYEGRPLWGRAVYTALHGARLSSVPSGDQSANPASVPGRSGFQRALLSVSSAQKCSGAGRLATPSGVPKAARSAVPCRSSAPGHRASRSKYTRDQSRETGSLSRLFGSMKTRWAGSGNGTRSEHSPEGGDHRGGPCSRQRVRVLQPYFIVPGKGVASVLDLS